MRMFGLFDAFRGKQNEFRYSFLCFRPSLREGREEKVAIVAELPFHNGRLILVAGRQPRIEDLDPLSQRIIEQLKGWLEATIRRTLDDPEVDDPLTALSVDHPWNLSFTVPESEKTSDFLSSVMELFGKEVLGLERSWGVGSSRDEATRTIAGFRVI